MTRKSDLRYGCVLQSSVAPHLFDAGNGVLAPSNLAAFRTGAAARTIFAHDRTLLEEREAQRIRSGGDVNITAEVGK